MNKIILYTGSDEVIISTPENEPNVIGDYFTEGGRDLDDYEREVLDPKEIHLKFNTSIYLGT